MKLRPEEEVLALAYCVLCEFDGLAEIVEGEFSRCPNCQQDGLIRDVGCGTELMDEALAVLRRIGAWSQSLMERGVE